MAQAGERGGVAEQIGREWGTTGPSEESQRLNYKGVGVGRAEEVGKESNRGLSGEIGERPPVLRGTRRRRTRFAGGIREGDLNEDWFFSFFIFIFFFFFFFFYDPGNAKHTTRGGRQASSPNVSRGGVLATNSERELDCKRVDLELELGTGPGPGQI
ncbi:hypothetical protein AXG93_2931s1170 [Marchantia polymorpha subsp. ruderalis]|uniref:Uncharacterized protein n=1 Tax=Marchantia polymorpha subsp. ruderalis TaxID=1480154 RepID=A0A176VXJ3_MARPO|nr:hypothetical protein AXG93_2931s1170 [Marchantia polymorpha subsp. ruderalis]